MKSIKGKILINMVSTVVISLLLIGIISIYLNFASTNDTLKSTMTEVAEVASDRVSQELTAYKNIAYETGSMEKLTRPLVSIAEKKEIIEQRVEIYQFTKGDLLDANGNSLFDRSNYSDREFFKEAIKGGAYVSTPSVNATTGEISIAVAAPLWKDGIPNSTIAGVVCFYPKETFLNNIVSSIQVSKNGQAYILDKNGYTIAHANMENVKNMENTVSDAKTNSKLAVLASLEQKMANGENGFGKYEYGGVKKLLAYAPIPGTDGWSIGINAPISDFMGSTIQSIIITAVFLIAAILIAIILAINLSNRIGRPIKACTDRLELLAEGDLNSPVIAINTKDETENLAKATETIVRTMSGIIKDLDWGLIELSKGDLTVDSQAKDLYIGDFSSIAASMYGIIDKLSSTIGQISKSAAQVAEGSEQVSNGSQALSQGATEQASSVEELAATLAEISKHIEETAEGAKEANLKVSGMGTEMTGSNQKMQSMMDAMTEISSSSNKIGKIIKTIEDIAFQTNILALNAAVEAARAGAAGKGFAVVADEVRNLANKSAEASKDTAALIEQSLVSVENGIRIADDAAASMMNAAKSAEEATKMVLKITQAAEEQAQSISQVTSGIDQISSVVQTNSATAEESAAASQELSGQAALLNQLVGQFKLKEY